MRYEIFYDMDNTLFEMQKALVGSYSGKIGTYGATKKITIDQIMKKLHQPGLFASFKPIQNSQAVLKKLNKMGYDVKILSQPMINDHCIKEKNYSLKTYFPFISLKNATYTFDKYLLAKNNRILIDDNIEHLENWQKNGGIAICFVRGYNKNFKGLRIKKHSEIFKILEVLEAFKEIDSIIQKERRI